MEIEICLERIRDREIEGEIYIDRCIFCEGLVCVLKGMGVYVTIKLGPNSSSSRLRET